MQSQRRHPMRFSGSMTMAGGIAIVLGVAGAPAHADFTDTFDTLDPAWGTDRYEPAGFAVENFDGDNRLKISISTDDAAINRGGQSGTFYNTQGRKRPGNIVAPWTVSADLYVDASFNTTSGDLRRTDLWARDSQIEALSHYPIIGITNESTTSADALDPNATDREVRFRIYDDTIDGWIDLGLPDAFTFDAWHNLSITATGTSFEFRIDGDVVHTDNQASDTGWDALTTVYLQAYNYGDSSYSVYWDNVSAVPEPASLALLSAGGLLMLKRRRTNG